METLQEQVETLTKLMAALEIPEEVKDENIENDVEVVYDFTSDEENPYNNPYTNFGIKRNKSYVEDDYQNQYKYGPPSLEENYLYRQGYEPIEDSDVDSDIDIYAYTTDSNSESDIDNE
ncbi:hypothetical protein L2E82_09213 [Cichorium intybus]|uniref:Uncharacterized protein n=1 Tax=Cichorium intybus TaxID=13427 RepID=A0ACB9G7V0_CICIN|nr:hypothetical protein L2E82_09213 [Cichorium intybus]